MIGAFFSPVYLLLLPSFNPRPDQTLPAKIKNLDYLGVVLQGGAFISGIMAINFGGRTYAWGSGQTIALFVVSGILFIIFGTQQSLDFLTAKNRVFPVHLVKMKEPVLLFIAMAACNAASYVSMYYIPLYFQFTKGVESLSSGVRLLPFIIAGTLTIMINGGVLSKTGFYMPWYLVGSILVLTGGVLLCKSFTYPLAILPALPLQTPPHYRFEATPLMRHALSSPHKPTNFPRPSLRLRNPARRRCRRLPASRVRRDPRHPRAHAHGVWGILHTARPTWGHRPRPFHLRRRLHQHRPQRLATGPSHSSAWPARKRDFRDQWRLL